MKKKKIFKILISISVLIVVAILGISYKVSNKLITPERELIQTNPKDKIGLDYKNIEFKSEGNNIKGWYIPSKENKFTIVYSHGYGGNRESNSLSTYDIIPEIHKMGGNFMSFDFSGEGQSTGKNVTVGYREQKDLINAIKEAKRISSAPVILYGISMGAATPAIVASNSNNIAGAICDSPFSNLRYYLESNLSVWTHLPDFPFKPIILGMEENIAGVKLEKVDPMGEVKKLKVPMLIIHGKGDDKIPYTESIKIASQNKNMIKLEIFDNNGHCQSLHEKRNEYLKSFIKFVEETTKNSKNYVK